MDGKKREEEGKKNSTLSGLCLWLHICEEDGEEGEEEENMKLYLFLTVIYRCTLLRVSSVMKASCVITDKVFHSLSVSVHCGRVGMSAERTTPERGHCSAARCQRRRGPSLD